MVAALHEDAADADALAAVYAIMSGGSVRAVMTGGDEKQVLSPDELIGKLVREMDWGFDPGSFHSDDVERIRDIRSELVEFQQYMANITNAYNADERSLAILAWYRKPRKW